eukprot:3490189-Rhodomonas_salina.6
MTLVLLPKTAHGCPPISTETSAGVLENPEPEMVMIWPPPAEAAVGLTGVPERVGWLATTVSSDVVVSWLPAFTCTVPVASKCLALRLALPPGLSRQVIALAETARIAHGSVATDTELSEATGWKPQPAMVITADTSRFTDVGEMDETVKGYVKAPLPWHLPLPGTTTWTGCGPGAMKGYVRAQLMRTSVRCETTHADPLTVTSTCAPAALGTPAVPAVWETEERVGVRLGSTVCWHAAGVLHDAAPSLTMRWTPSEGAGAWK